MKTAVVIDIRRHPPQRWEEGITRFLSWKKAQGAAERTLADYRDIVTLFFRRFPLAWSPSCRECLAVFLSQEGIAVTTHNIRLKYLKPFFEFITREGAFTESPAANFKYRRGEEPRIVDHSMENIEKMFDRIWTASFPILRDAALLLFSLDNGIRPSEALGLGCQGPAKVELTVV